MSNENPAPPVEVATPAVPPVDPTPNHQPATPPAAHLVINGEKSEREIELERRLEEKERVIKNREREVATHQLEVQRLKELTGAPAPKPAKRRGFYGWENN